MNMPSTCRRALRRSPRNLSASKLVLLACVFVLCGSAASTAASSSAAGVAASSAAGVEQAPEPGRAKPTCGKPGLPPCPLQHFMRTRVAAPLAANNSVGLAKGLTHVSTLSPDASWTAWPTYALAGAKAAQSGDVTEARKACTGCHGTYRAEYRKRFRPRPIGPADGTDASPDRR